MDHFTEKAAFFLKLTTKEATYIPHTVVGGLAGAGLGAAQGAMVGGEGHRGQGALLGGAVGGALGAGGGALSAHYLPELRAELGAMPSIGLDALGAVNRATPWSHDIGLLAAPLAGGSLAGAAARNVQPKEASAVQAALLALQKEAAVGAAIGGAVGGALGGGFAWNAARPRAGGKSKDQISHENKRHNKANEKANEGKEYNPSWWARKKHEGADWASEHPGAAAGIGAVPGAAAGAFAGHAIEAIVKSILKDQAARDLILHLA